ncbi:MAG TPA: hypothetical protein VFI21_00985 [Nocardioides sp.]|jgi:hypothetical protein|nr:hypothetical protein [Nocardioides sp.]
MTESGTSPAAETPPAAAGPAAPVEPSVPVESAEPVDGEPAAAPSWWHTSHPTFAGLVGFFVGVAYVIVVPGIYVTVLSLLLSDENVQRLFPLVAVALVIPLALLIPRKTRRFAQFMLLGLVCTALVIALTATLVIWVMVQLDG